MPKHLLTTARDSRNTQLRDLGRVTYVGIIFGEQDHVIIEEALADAFLHHQTRH